MIDVFCSYAHKDELLRHILDVHLSVLKRERLIAVWYDRHIVPGAEWEQHIKEHLETAAIILLLVSPDFLASDYCHDVETRRALERHQRGEACVIPIILRPCDWRRAPFAHLQCLPCEGKPVTTWDNQDEAFDDITQGLRRAIENLGPLSPNVPPAAHPAVWNLPYARNPFFTGREDVLTQLQHNLTSTKTAALSQPQVISGLGGIGKTQTAIEYAYRHAQDYQAVLWARAESQQELISSYVEIAALLTLPEQDAQDQQITVQAVKRWLHTHGGWLLILDNADDVAILPDFLPPVLGGHLLVTTRAHATGNIATLIEVEQMDLHDGTLLLLRRAKLLAPHDTLEQANTKDRTEAEAIVKEMDGFPLALDQAGAYLEETGTSLSGYLALYHQRRKELLARRSTLPSNYPQSVATTWSLSFQTVQQQSAAAAELLRFCAFLAPEAIPEELITKGAAHLGPVLKPVAADPFKLDEAMAQLGAFSLLRRTPQDQMVSMHRLVQAVLQEGMDEDTQRQWAERAVRAVDAAFPDVTDYRHWPLCQHYLPHAQVCAHWIATWEFTFPEAAHLLNEVGYYLDDRALYAQAEPLYQRALAIRERVLGAEHPDTALSLNNLAALYRSQGQYEQAEPLLKRALAIWERMLGAEHPNTATSLNNLAELYRSQGRYELVEPLLQRTLAIRKQVLGPEHPYTARSLNNLAALYKNQGQYEQAEPLYQQALAIWERVLGAEHPDTARSLNNLAELYRSRGQYEQAEPLYQRALAICERVLGAEHPTTVVVRKNYASLRHDAAQREQTSP